MLWRKIQKTNFVKLDQLSSFLELPREKLGTPKDFALNLPKRLAQKIQKNTLDDPILRQFVPLKEENQSPLGFIEDPVGDKNFCKTEKYLQKYEGRALLLTTSACAMHCRYCFRQNFDYSNHTGFENELKLIAQDTSLHEIILSGGDPLSLSDEKLDGLLTSLDATTHVQLIRFHTRFPIGIPERIDQNFLSLLSSIKTQITFVIHANHASEFDDDILSALKSVQKCGIPVLLQAVLLANINDDLATLKELFLTCASNGILPYYLHQLDRVQGAAHFEVPTEKGKQLIASLRACLPGYAVPRFVQEIEGMPNKTLLN